VPTFALVMAVLLSSSLAFTLMGGQLTAMVVDCVEGMLSLVMYLIVAVALLCLFNWSRVSEALTSAPAHESLINPFDSSRVQDFNLWFVLIGIAASVYARNAWQGNQGFNCSAASPHEQKMGGVLGAWRNFARLVMITLLAISAYTYLNHPAYGAQAEQVRHSLQQIDNEFVRRQMQVPVALGWMLPLGIKGVFCSIMLFALLACDSSYLHSWGSIVVQDVILPLRRERPTPKQHMRWLRLAVTGVAAFAFVFSLLVPPADFILMYFAVTGAIFTGGAGSVILGGLYWKRGTTPAAWSAMLTGSAVATGGIVLQYVWVPLVVPRLMKLAPDSAFLAAHADEFPINGQWLLALSIVSAVGVYVATSLFTCRRDFDMDHMLHRGRWAVNHAGPHARAAGEAPPRLLTPTRTWRTLLGIDEQFTPGDKLQSVLLFSWSMFWFAVFVVVSLWNLFDMWPAAWWATYWYVVGILMPLAVLAVTAVWFTVGGVRDLRRLFERLAVLHRDTSDDGTVKRMPEPGLAECATAASTPRETTPAGQALVAEK
jgi:SSS family solute:Na+ symporter